MQLNILFAATDTEKQRKKKIKYLHKVYFKKVTIFYAYFWHKTRGKKAFLVVTAINT